MSRGDFWRMHPGEFWWLYEARKPATPYAGGKMSEDEARSIYQEAYGDGQCP